MVDLNKDARLKAALRDNLKKRKKAIRNRDDESLENGHNSDKNYSGNTSES